MRKKENFDWRTLIPSLINLIDEFHPLKEVLIDGVTDEQRKIIEAETYS